MKTILVDAINCFVTKEGMFQEMYKLLEEYPNKKIVLTGADDEGIKDFGLDKLPYDVFTLKHNPDKENPEYYEILLKNFNLDPEDVLYFEHRQAAVKSARSIGITTFHYDKDKKDLAALKEFLDQNV